LSALFTGLTAFAAVLMFVFKDAILGLVAGIQISSNDIIRIGDYIEMPKRDTDGTVIDISLSVVKVHNANRTISTIPTYAFVSESFWNWRGLDISDGRRIRRFLYLDMSTIRPCNDEMLKKLRGVELLKPYFETRDKEYAINLESNIWHGKYYTNVTLFRAYVEAYLRNNPKINTTMNLMVRHLQPNEHGLPIEIYTYTKEKNGPLYEAIQADIFDHIIAAVSEFGLKLFQKPSGYDVRNS
jgi:miniconductance mechanosensitive channel